MTRLKNKLFKKTPHNYDETFVRKAKATDIESLIELRKLLLNQGSGHYVSANAEEQFAWQVSYKNWLLENLDHNPIIRVIGCSDNKNPEKLMGCAIGIIDQRVPHKGCLNGKMGWVQTMVVHPDFRRKGIAKKLMEDLLGWFVQNHVGKVALQSTENAHPLYEKLGFQDSREILLIKSLLH
jgi:GNAT superfamily N-acetyltransferase